MEGNYANIIIDISHEKVDRPFQYKIPQELRGKLEVGMEVEIPFGSGNHKRNGYIIEITDTPNFDTDKLKEISGISNHATSIENEFIQLAYWMKTTYGSTMIQALKTVLPVKQKVKALDGRKAVLKLSKEEALARLEDYEKKHQTARARLLQELIEANELSFPHITGKLNVTAKTIEALAEQNILTIMQKDKYRNPVAFENAVEERKTLSDEQQKIVHQILEEEEPSVSLIHGITGSGKTEVYMQLIEGTLAKGKQAIVLIPEIALTYQTVSRFVNRFGNQVSIINSRLSKGERFDQMERAKKGDIQVMIGPRSALFTPFANLGILIIDEEHESSYKSENMPKYHAREVAKKIAAMHGAKLVLGSATPSLEAYYEAKQGKIKLYELTERLTGGTLPTVYIEDLRKELKEGNRSIFSRRLYGLIQDRLAKKEQIILFLNRRGYAGFVSCRACGHVMKCPHCDVSLSEHQGGKLVCHYCGYEEAKVTNCPSCGSKYILGFKAGTQQIEELIKKEFQGARVLRMDGDTTKTKNSYEEILEAFSKHEADILIGTQMIVKGHDFPKVTLVGILAADLSLSVNDYRAGERTFQLLTQAAGRAGRGDIPGEVVIQTYQPEHYSILHAAKQDYQGFYEEEILYRDLMMYPPVAHMMAVLITSREEKKGEALASQCVEQITSFLKEERGIVIGPAKATIGKISDTYRYVIYVKHKDYDILIKTKDLLEEYICSQNLQNEMIQFDFNPISGY